MIFGRSTPHLIDKIGDFNINQAISAGVIYTHQIALGENGYKNGYCSLMIPQSVSTALARRRSAFLTFTSDLNDAHAQSGGYTTYTIVGYYGIPYYFTDKWILGYKYSVDSRLSDSYFSTTGDIIRIIRCAIVGQNLEIDFKNTHASVSKTLQMDGTYVVSK